jgi:hypothetical protein
MERDGMEWIRFSRPQQRKEEPAGYKMGNTGIDDCWFGRSEATPIRPVRDALLHTSLSIASLYLYTALEIPTDGSEEPGNT